MRRLFLFAAMCLLQATAVFAVNLNSRGQISAGVGGTAVSFEGVVIARPAGGAAFVTDDQIVYQICENFCRLEVYDVRTQTKTVVSAVGANSIEAGGGVWAAWLGGYGLYTSTALKFDGPGLGPVGPDGAIAIKDQYQSYGPWSVLERSGQRWQLTAGDASVINLLGAGRAAWQEVGKADVQVKGIPSVSTLSGIRWWLKVAQLNGHWWVLYQTEQGGRLVLHPIESAERGYVLAAGNTYRPAIVAMNATTARVAWATREDEAPEVIVKVDVDLTAPMVALTTAPPPPPPAPPTPPPPVDPQLPTMPEAVCATVKAERAKLGNITTYDGLGALLNRIAWAHRADGWGLSGKRGGEQCDRGGGVFVACDILQHGLFMWDVLGASGQDDQGVWGPAFPMCGESIGAQEDPNDRPFVAPVDPGDVVEPPTPPPPSTELETLRARVVQLEAESTAKSIQLDQQRQEIGTLRADVEEARAELSTARQRIAELENAPQPTCVAKVPGWLRSLGVRVGCEIVR